MPNPGELPSGLQPARLLDFGSDITSNPYLDPNSPSFIPLSDIQAAIQTGIRTNYTTKTGQVNFPVIVPATQGPGQPQPAAPGSTSAPGGLIGLVLLFGVAGIGLSLFWVFRNHEKSKNKLESKIGTN